MQDLLEVIFTFQVESHSLVRGCVIDCILADEPAPRIYVAAIDSGLPFGERHPEGR